MAKDLYDMTDEELEQAYLAEKEAGEVDEQTTDNQEQNTEDEAGDEGVQDTNEEQSDSEVEDMDGEGEEQVENNLPETPKLYKIKANGLDYDFTEDDLVKLAPKALDYTKKMQTIAPYRKAISAMEENGITQEDINLLIDIKKGNKEALATLVHNQGIDAYDIPSKEEIKYVPTDYGKTEQMLALQDVVSKISGDAEYSQTQQVVQALDPISKQQLGANPSMLEGLHRDIQQGIYQRIMPQANKLAALDGYSKPFLDYYVQTAQIEYEQQNKQLKQQQLAKAQQQQKVQQQKKVAGIPNQGKKVTSMIDGEISDEDYEEWYRNNVANRY